MPKLLVQKKPSRKNATRRTEYTVPSSPFQKLIHTKMTSLRLSMRQLAQKMTEAGGKTYHSNLWTWLHHPNGFPHPKSFKNSHAQALSKVLGIKLAEIHAALDASRRIYTPKQEAQPAAALDTLAALEAMVEGYKSRYIKRDSILNFIKTLRRGSE